MLTQLGLAYYQDEHNDQALERFNKALEVAGTVNAETTQAQVLLEELKTTNTQVSQASRKIFR